MGIVLLLLQEGSTFCLCSTSVNLVGIEEVESGIKQTAIGD